MKTKWINFGLVMAGLFISGVMIFLITAGVQLKERRMIKWSQVESAQKAGQQVGRFLFPLIQQRSVLRIETVDEFGQQFFATLQKEALKNNTSALITMSSQKTQKDEFLISIRPLGNNENREECAAGVMQACAEKTAIRKFPSQKVKTGQGWMTMYRLGENEAILFYKQVQ